MLLCAAAFELDVEVLLDELLVPVVLEESLPVVLSLVEESVELLPLLSLLLDPELSVEELEGLGLLVDVEESLSSELEVESSVLVLELEELGLDDSLGVASYVGIGVLLSSVLVGSGTTVECVTISRTTLSVP